MPVERERLRLYSNRYPQVPEELIRDLNRILDSYYTQILGLEELCETQQAELDDHESRITVLEP